MKTAISDLHCHPTLRLYNGEKSIWYNDETSNKKRDNKQPNYSEAEFAALAKSRVRLVFVALYPIEQGFISNLGNEIDLIPEKPLENEIINFSIKNIIENYSRSGTLLDFLEKVTSKYISGMKFKKFNKIRSFEHEYFDDLMGEYNYLVNGTKIQSPLIKSKFFNLNIVSDYTELKNLLKIDDEFNYNSEADNNIAIVLTVEGGHSLGIGQYNTKHLTFEMLNELNSDKTFKIKEVENLFNKVKNNISTLKNLGNSKHCPFFLTFAHHFWNQLCGHNMSFASTAHRIFDQQQGLNTPITEFGKKVINELLSKTNGRRILIDTKHMSVKTKLWYYNFVENYNNNNGDKIPIISSHSAVSGNKNISIQNNDNPNIMDDKYDKSLSPFNIWDINLSDEEILIIHQSEGLIGLNFDERILSGKKMLDFIKEQSFSDAEIENYRSRWAEPVLQNIVHIIEVVINSNNENKEHVWDMITIGTDYDGIINPIDAYCYAEDLENLRNMLIKKLDVIRNAFQFLNDKDSTEIIDNIMFKNSLRFLNKHFNYNNTKNTIA